MRRPDHFEAHADGYDAARPPYPNELWQRLRDLGLLQPGTQALDLGAGSGQATGPLLAAGLDVTAVEPGEQLAARLRARFPAASLTVSRAEDVTLTEASLDLVVAATSIHWMDLDVLLPKVYRALRPAGALAVWRNVFGDPDITTPFRERVAQIVRERGQQLRLSPAEEVERTSADLTRSGLFVAEHTSQYRWSIELDADQVRGLFSTFSDWTPAEVDRAAGAVRDLGGRVTEHYRSWLIVLRRRE